MSHINEEYFNLIDTARKMNEEDRAPKEDAVVEPAITEPQDKKVTPEAEEEALSEDPMAVAEVPVVEKEPAADPEAVVAAEETTEAPVVDAAPAKEEPAAAEEEDPVPAPSPEVNVTVDAPAEDAAAVPEPAMAESVSEEKCKVCKCPKPCMCDHGQSNCLETDESHGNTDESYGDMEEMEGHSGSEEGGSGESDMDAQDTERGTKIADLLGLRKKENGRYDTDWGDKTPMGLVRTLRRLLEESKDGGSFFDKLNEAEEWDDQGDPAQNFEPSELQQRRTKFVNRMFDGDRADDIILVFKRGLVIDREQLEDIFRDWVASRHATDMAADEPEKDMTPSLKDEPEVQRAMTRTKAKKNFV